MSKKLTTLFGGMKGGIVVISAALFVGVAVFVAYSTSGVMEREARNTVAKAVNATVKRINQQMSEVENVTKGTVQVVSDHLEDPDFMYKITEKLVRDNPLIVGSTVAFEPNYFKEKGLYYAPYTWQEPDGSTHNKQLGNKDNHYFDQEWYAEAVKAKVALWSEPYYDIGGYKVMMSTYSVPLLDEKQKVYAILTADVALTDLSNYVRSINPYPESYALLYSAGGMKLVDIPENAHEIFSTVTVKGVADNGWAVELICPLSAILRDTQSLVLRIVLFIAVGLAFVFFVFWFFSSRLERERLRLEQEAEEARKIAQHLELNAELEVAKRASEEKSKFLFNMSHDIRTPMNAIMGFNDMASKYIDNKERVLDCLQKIHTSSELLLTIINDILDMSRIESGKVVLNETPCDIRIALSDVKPMLMELAKNKDINLTFAEGKVWDFFVYIDTMRANRIFMNIVSNAIKYTSAGGWVKANVRQLPSKLPEYALYEFTISDNGIGMGEDFQKHIFEAFAREENSTVSGIQGTGLGLALCKKLVELMHGQITVESIKGKGSTFKVLLPFRLQKENDILECKHQNEHSEEYQFSGKKVLIVEDNELNREIAEELLEESGFIVDDAENGRIAVDKILARGIDYYDFILMDIQMPEMNGYDATTAIRKLPGGENIIIIALSANAFEEDKQKSLAVGMNAHIAKPIKIKELLTVLKSFM